MIFDKEALQKVLKEKGVKTTEDLQEILRELTGEIIGLLYEGELTDHLGYEKHDQKASSGKNSRNGKGKKTVQSQFGPVELTPPRDRAGSFEPEIVKKRETDITGMETKVLSMYGKGMTVRDIRDHIFDIYGYEISAEKVSTITDTVLKEAHEWQSRPLNDVYAVVFMDGIVIKLRKDGVVKNHTVYLALGIDLEGRKSCLGIYLSENESAKYWLTVLNEFKNRGIQDVLIFAVDNLTGMSEAIETAYPEAEIQKCIVHQIRNSLKFVPWKERKQVAADLKRVYTAATEKEGFQELENFAEKWDCKYPHISQSWKRNWPELSTFFKYSPEIRKLIYTTNPIESFNRQIRKVTKNRGAFPTEDSAIKLLYLAIRDIKKKWEKGQGIRLWGKIYSELCIYFGDRITNNV